jgi:hypothetical protein
MPMAYFNAVEASYDSVVLKELIMCGDFEVRYTKFQNHLFLRYILSEVLTIKSASELILQTSATIKLSLLFKNILLCCRLLPLEYQNTIYGSIGKLYTQATSIASLHNQRLPELTTFLPCLFELDSLSLSGGISSANDESLYSETIAHFLNAIIASSLFLFSNEKFLGTLLPAVWKICATKISWGAFTIEDDQEKGYAQILSFCYPESELI